jgi:intraflagellar transport protein 122
VFNATRFLVSNLGNR